MGELSGRRVQSDVINPARYGGIPPPPGSASSAVVSRGSTAPSYTRLYLNYYVRHIEVLDLYGISSFHY